MSSKNNPPLRLSDQEKGHVQRELSGTSPAGEARLALKGLDYLEVQLRGEGGR